MKTSSAGRELSKSGTHSRQDSFRHVVILPGFGIDTVINVDADDISPAEDETDTIEPAHLKSMECIVKGCPVGGFIDVDCTAPVSRIRDFPGLPVFI